MDVKDPFGALLPGTETEILKVLATTNVYASGSEIGRRAGKSHPAALKVLDRFSQQGLVSEFASGRSRQFVLNRNHLAAGPLIELTNLRGRLFKMLSLTIEIWSENPESAVIFGSVATKSGDSASDIDLLLVRPKDIEDEAAWAKQVDNLFQLVYEWTGNHLAVSEVSLDEVRDLKRRNPELSLSLLKDGIHIFGNRISRLIG